ncbi:MAG: carboxypeptidase-like regulatory domain-containing protein [Bryobacteraceae bacterium]
MRPIACTASLLVLTVCAFASDGSAIFGVVKDSSGAVLPRAKIQVQNESTGDYWRTSSNREGRYSFRFLPPGVYKITVRQRGFRTISHVGAVLDPGRSLAIEFSLKLLTLREVVTVIGKRDRTDPSSGSNLLITRGEPGTLLPSNSSDPRQMFDLLPGVVIAPAGPNDGGQFTSNGQRPNANDFQVDGVNANTGVSGSSLPGSFPGASLPAMSASGSIANLSTSEDTESVEFRTSNFAPKSGFRLGAQASIRTRSGSNQFHFGLIGHMRARGWAAQDWFANAANRSIPRPYYRDFEGDFGGPLWHNRTFFFLSAANSYLESSGLERTIVPALAARQQAPASIGNILAAFPPPAGAELPGNQSEGFMHLGRTGSSQSYSARIDQSLGAWGALFARFVRAPSSSQADQLDAIEGVSAWRSATVGVNVGRNSGATHEFRFNYSRSAFRSTFSGTSWAGAFQLGGLLPTSESPGIWRSITSLLPAAGASANVWGMSIPGLGQFILGDYGRTEQDQWEIRETSSIQKQRHEIQVGFDYLLLQPSREAPLTSIFGEASSLQSLLNARPFNVTVSELPKRGSNVNIASLFVQDRYRVAPNLNIIYGTRWELTPPTSAPSQIPTVSGLWTGSKWATIHVGNVVGRAPWHVNYEQIEPRLGLAYGLPGIGVVLRAAAGVFYDPTLGATLNPVNGAPFNSWLLSAGRIATGSAESLNRPSASLLRSAALSPDVVQFLTGPYPALKLPVSYQWRASLEKHVGPRGVGSVAYVGSTDGHLLGNEVYVDPNTGILDRGVTLTQNSSDYESLQVRYTGSPAENAYISSSYAWSHCIDDGSAGSSIFLIHPGYDLREAKGSCSYDIRHAFTLAASYRIPPTSSRTHAWLSGWTVSGILRARTGFPINVIDNEQTLGQIVNNAARPNLVPGVRVWIADASAPGKRRLNPAAFEAPLAGRQGTLGRNAIYGNGLAQLDLSICKRFEASDGISFETGLNVFNLLNHPAFANPVPFLSNPLFGQSASMQNLMLGSGTPNTGLSPLFQSGGPRSAEFFFRFSF